MLVICFFNLYLSLNWLNPPSPHYTHNFLLSQHSANFVRPSDLWFINLVISLFPRHFVSPLDKCELPRAADGCFNENKSDRALSTLIINDVDMESSKFMGIFRVDYDNWDQYMEGLICRCARKAKEEGYSHFGIFNEGTCHLTATSNFMLNNPYCSNGAHLWWFNECTICYRSF